MAPGRHLYPDARPEYSLGIPQKASMCHSQLYNTVKVDHLSYSIESQVGVGRSASARRGRTGAFPSFPHHATRGAFGRLENSKMTSVGFEPTPLFETTS